MSILLKICLAHFTDGWFLFGLPYSLPLHDPLVCKFAQHHWQSSWQFCGSKLYDTSLYSITRGKNVVWYFHLNDSRRPHKWWKEFFMPARKAKWRLYATSYSDYCRFFQNMFSLWIIKSALGLPQFSISVVAYTPFVSIFELDIQTLEWWACLS